MITNKKSITVLVLCILLSLSYFPEARGEKVNVGCNDGTVIAFFNGVGNDENAAIKSLDEIKNVVMEIPGVKETYQPVDKYTFRAYDGKQLRFVLFHNHTRGAHKDVIETFRLRAKELYPHMTLDKLNLLVNGENDRIIRELISNCKENPESTDEYSCAQVRFLTNLYIEMRKRLLNEYKIIVNQEKERISELSDIGLVDYDLVNHRMKIDEMVKYNENIVFIGHSEGNLFEKLAYDYLISNYHVNGKVSVIHIAPPFAKKEDLIDPINYVLADIDEIINPIVEYPPTLQLATQTDRLLYSAFLSGALTGEEVLQLAFSTRAVNRVDMSGHMLIETYLDPTRAGRARIKNLIRDALESFPRYVTVRYVKK